MSSITGIFYRDGRKVDPELIKKMNDMLSHRGHDGSAVWYEDSVAFGHQMLWTTSESLREKLPFHDDKSDLVITADARIDNRKELSDELGIEDNEDISDSYFILKAYEKWGEKCPEYLLGDFAFAIWDENEEKLFCARDHMGVKPFFYYLDDENFIFSTEIKAIFAIPEVPHELNEQMVAFYLMNIYNLKSTFYKKIFNLYPAHSLTIKYKSNKSIEYWKLDHNSKITFDTEEEYINKFRSLFKEAVKCRLRTIFPIGFELSGGIDSSSVVCMAKKIINDCNYSFNKIDTFSFIFNEFIKCDERYYIEKVTTSEIIHSIFISGDNISPLESMDEILWYQDKPLSSPNFTILWNLYKKMQKRDIRVVLSGEGGDAVVSHGKYYFKDLAFTFKWKKLANEYYNYTKHYNMKFYDIEFYYYFLIHVFPSFINFIKKIFNKKILNVSMLEEDFLNKVNAKKHWNLYLKSVKKPKNARMKHYYDLKHNKAILNALMVRDGLSSAFSTEIRYPFLDKRLVEFCYAIPTEIKFKYGWSRYILRIAMENVLPFEIQWRPTKANLSSISKRNMLLFEKNMLDKMIIDENKKIRKFLDLDMLNDIYKDAYNGNENYDLVYNLFLASQLFLFLNYYEN